MPTKDYLQNTWTGLVNLYTSDSTLRGYAATPYYYDDTIIIPEKKFPAISVELKTERDGEWESGKMNKIVTFHTKTYTNPNTESATRTQHINLTGRVMELLESRTNQSYATGVYRLDNTVEYNYENIKLGPKKMVRVGRVSTDVYVTSTPIS